MAQDTNIYKKESNTFLGKVSEKVIDISKKPENYIFDSHFELAFLHLL